MSAQVNIENISQKLSLENGVTATSLQFDKISFLHDNIFFSVSKSFSSNEFFFK